MGGKFSKKRTVIALKTDNTFSRHDQVRRGQEHLPSNVSLNSLEAEETPPQSPRLVPKKPNKKTEDSACSQVVRRVDVSTDQRRKLHPSQHASFKASNRRTLVGIIAAAPLATPTKIVGFSEHMVIENFRNDDPYDKLKKGQFNRRPSNLEHLGARTGSLKLLKHGKPRRRPSESEEEDTIAKIVHEAKEAKPDHRRATVQSSAKDEGLRYLEGQHRAEGQKGRSTAYRLTHRRTISHKIIHPAQEANWSAFNSKRAERVWQWRGAYGSLAKVES
jgi:hypothetical protein